MATQPTVLLSDLAARLTALEDEKAIRTAHDRYGHSIDYGLETEWVDCFVSDGIYDIRMRVQPPGIAEFFPYAQVDAKSIRVAGRDALAQFAAHHTRAPAAYHKHVVVDQVISRDGDPDHASSTSYFLRVDDVNGRPEVVSFGRYFDKLKRCKDGRWRFLERVIEVESNSAAPTK